MSSSTHSMCIQLAISDVERNGTSVCPGVHPPQNAAALHTSAAGGTKTGRHGAGGTSLRFPCIANTPAHRHNSCLSVTQLHNGISANLSPSYPLTFILSSCLAGDRIQACLQLPFLPLHQYSLCAASLLRLITPPHSLRKRNIVRPVQ